MGATDFLKRHRRKFLVGIGLSASIYWGVRYIGDKLREFQEKLILDRLTREDLERRFDQNQKDATFTTLALLPTVSMQILDEYNVEQTRHELQELRSAKQATDDPASSQELANSVNSSMYSSLNSEGRGAAAAAGDASSLQLSGSQTSSAGGSSSGSAAAGGADGSYVAAPSKAQLWNKIKIQSLTRVVLLVYSAALLTVLTRIQLNILGRKAYAESVEHATLEPGSVSEEALLADEQQVDAVNRQYLTFSWWLLHKGWRLLAQRVEAAVRSATADVEPPTRLTFEGLNELFGRIHKSVDEKGTFLDVLLPPEELETFVLSQIPGEEVSEVDAQLRGLLTETRDIVLAQSCVEVVQKLVHSGLAVLMKKMHTLYVDDAPDIRLAIALMQAAKQAPQIAAGSPMTNEYIEAMVDVPELDALSAAVYSNY